MTELEHSNSLLQMENDIVGERLKILFQDTIGVLNLSQLTDSNEL